MTSGERGVGFDMLAWGRLVVLRRQVVFVAFASQCSLTSASEVQILHDERTSIPDDAILIVGFRGLRDEQREAQFAPIAAFVLLTCASSDCWSWSQLHGLP